VKAATAIQGAPRATPRQRVHVIGTVTAAKPREWLTLRTEEGSVEVTTRQTNTFAPGEVLSVACWPLNKNGRLLLQDGVCRSLSAGAQPAPVKLQQGFFNLNMQRELVEITGTVRDHTFSGANPRYLIALPNGLQCALKWDELMRRDQLPMLQDGSMVRLTGIFVANPNGGLQDDGAGFGLLPRSASDITVLRGPSWWTRQRLEWTIWGLLAVVGIALPGAAAFRWQVWRQARHIRDIEGRAVAGEERRRIAREFHDSLQQQLAAAALHLETVKGAVDAAPEMLPRLLDDTTAMIRHCQLEAQHCIWDLRTDSPAREDLAASLDAWLRSRSAAEAARVEFHLEGQLPPLEETAPFQILRICQEAVNNALAHAGASRITVTLRGDATGVSIKVVDNGRGFDRGLLESPKHGHFGLDSLRERARHIGARLEISTMLHKGTTVSLHMPKHNKKHEKTF
jgi:signal transduction histidine kinase